MSGIHTVAFIGLGIMGKPMARNLRKAGFDLQIFARTKAKVEDVIAEGMTFHDTIRDCVASADAVITIIGFPPDVEEVYFKAGNILDSARPGAYLIDMTTTAPSLAVKIAKEGTARGYHVLDAPVTGGDIGAQAGTLSILVGGDEDDFHACEPLFQAMGKTITLMGPAGCGQHAKMANQTMIAGTIAGVCEGLSYAAALGLDLQKLYDAVSTGGAASNQLTSYGPRIMDDDFDPGFMIKHFVKDMRLARAESENVHLNLAVLRQALLEYELLEAEGAGDKGTQALMDFYRRQC